MSDHAPKVRLYVEHPLGPAQSVPLECEQARHLFNVLSPGPRILRVDTAAVASLTLWQDRLGDWH